MVELNQLEGTDQDMGDSVQALKAAPTFIQPLLVKFQRSI